jgi:hypothetical protein
MILLFHKSSAMHKLDIFFTKKLAKLQVLAPQQLSLFPIAGSFYRGFFFFTSQI